MNNMKSESKVAIYKNLRESHVRILISWLQGNAIKPTHFGEKLSVFPERTIPLVSIS